MPSLNHEQRRLDYRGRSFLFVSYAAEDRSKRSAVTPRGPTWYLVVANHRWPAVPYRVGQAVEEVDALCIGWLEEVVFAAAAAPPLAAAPVQRFLRAEGEHARTP